MCSGPVYFQEVINQLKRKVGLLIRKHISDLKQEKGFVSIVIHCAPKTDACPTGHLVFINQGQ